MTFRHAWPIASLALVVAAVTTAELLHVGFLYLASPVVAAAMYAVATRYGRRVSVPALGVTIVATYLAVVISGGNAVQTVAAVVGWLAGDTVRSRRTGRAELARQRQREADERLRRALAEERLTISRELHDVISHNLSVIAVQAGVGRMLFDEQPAQARDALADIERVSRSALAELRRLLTDVREQSLAPMPGVADVPALVGSVGAVLEARGTPVPLPATLGLSVYRIVQEALTNAVKYAGPSRRRVAVTYAEDTIEVEITDDGQGAVDYRPGWGIVGMRERVALFGGTLDVGPRPEGGFQVRARLPIGAPQ